MNVFNVYFTRCTAFEINVVFYFFKYLVGKMLQVKILPSVPASCGEDRESEEGRKIIWCLEGDNPDGSSEDRIEWGNRTALCHLITVLKVENLILQFNK